MEYFFRNTSMLLTGLLLLTLASCDVSDSDKGNGTLNVKMHDRPVLYDSVNVEIQQVQVNVGDGWKPVMDTTLRVNLLDLVNGTFAELGAVELEAGEYEQIRLILGGNNSVTVDGQSYSLKVPSAQQSGLKLNVDFTIESGTTTELLLDFDAQQSVHKRGANQTYIMRPVIHANVRTLTGDIEGSVSPASSRPWILAMSGTDTVSTTLADSASGDFELVGLKTGTYDVVFQPTDTTYADTTVADVQVSARETQDMGTINIPSKN